MSKDWLNTKVTNHVQELLTDDYYTVEVSFNQHFESKTIDRLYTYKVDNRLTIEEDDMVVVLAKGDFKVCKVIKKHAHAEIDFSANYKYQYVVSKVDTSLYDELQARAVKIEQAVVAMQKNSIKRELLNEFATSYNTEDLAKLEAEIGTKLIAK